MDKIWVPKGWGPLQLITAANNIHKQISDQHWNMLSNIERETLDIDISPQQFHL